MLSALTLCLAGASGRWPEGAIDGLPRGSEGTGRFGTDFESGRGCLALRLRGRGGDPFHVGQCEGLREKVAAAENGNVHSLPGRRKARNLLAHGFEHQRRAIQRAIAFSRQAKGLARAGGGVAGGGGALRGGEKARAGHGYGSGTPGGGKVGQGRDEHLVGAGRVVICCGMGHQHLRRCLDDDADVRVGAAAQALDQAAVSRSAAAKNPVARLERAGRRQGHRRSRWPQRAAACQSSQGEQGQRA